jgi:hypothetical protein
MKGNGKGHKGWTTGPVSEREEFPSKQKARKTCIRAVSGSRKATSLYNRQRILLDQKLSDESVLKEHG